MQPNQLPVPERSRGLIIAAWVVTLLVSALPDILWAETGPGSPPWLVMVKMALLVVLALAAAVWKRLRPLRNFFILMAVFYGLTELRPRIDFTIPALQALFGGSLFDLRMQAEQTGKLAAALVMILALLLLGYRRREFFLTPGNLRAPIRPVPLLGFPKPALWPVFGLQWGFYIAAALAVVQYLGMRPGGDLLTRLLPLLPSVLFYAALNAFNEEVLYRAPMLAALEPICGGMNALWMAAYFFGIAHYFGTPGGIAGGVASIFMGWILGKGMLETRGLFWTWWIHFLSDVAIFSFLAMALLQAQP